MIAHTVNSDSARHPPSGAVGAPYPAPIRIAFIVLISSIPAALNAVVELTLATRNGGHVDALRLVVSTAAPWYLWSIVAPLVILMVRRFPVAWPIRSSALALHVASPVVITWCFVLVKNEARRLAGVPVATGGVLDQMIGWFTFQAFGYAAVVAIATAGEYARRAREETLQRALLAEQLAQAELYALRMQLHPHFLFNALNTIAMLVREHDAETAVHLIAELGEILREVLTGSSTTQALLTDELRFVGRYLGIEQVRFGSRLCIEWDVDPQASQCVVPPLIVQPLVENAIVHGLAHVTGVGVLRIAAKCDGDSLRLTVEDNGPAISLATPSAASARSGAAGVGIANTRRRLTQVYGADATLRIERLAAGRTRATIILPIDNDSKVATHV